MAFYSALRQNLRVLASTPYNWALPAADAAGTINSNGSGTLSIVAALSAGGSDTQVQFNDGGSAFGGDAGLAFNKSTNVLTAGGVVVSGTGASALDVGGGLNIGTGNVALVNTAGKITALSGTEVANLSGAALTSLNGSNVSSGTVAAARLGSGSTYKIVETKDKTTAYTMLATDCNVTADAVGGAFSITLISSPTDGQMYTVRRVNAGANDVTIAGNGTNINGVSSIALTSQYESVILIYNANDGEWGIY